MVDVNVTNGTLEQNEINAYVDYVKSKNVGKELVYLNIKVDGDFVELEYKTESIPFERIRRITGYLVGTVDRFNNSKRAEEHDRVKHSF